MNARLRLFSHGFGVAAILMAIAAPLPAQQASQFTTCQRLTNQELSLRLTALRSANFRLEVSTNLTQWDSLVTAQSAGFITYTDSAAPFLSSRFYRAFQLTDTNVVTGDHLVTADGDVVIHPINHATLVLTWNTNVIYVDPVGGATRFTGLPRPDLILLTHAHSDHFDTATITAVKKTNTVIVASKIAYASLTAGLKSGAIQMTNGAVTNVLSISIDAIAAYNTNNNNHLKGDGNGYVLTIGGKRIYMSGDTSNIPEMRALQGIDVSFLCVNSFTMTVAEAANAARAFKPKVAYPYHYQSNGVNSDLNAFKKQVGTDLAIEVRFRAWY